MTAADQPTTEPSAEQSLSEIRENATSPNSHMTVEGFEEAMANILAPAPQPAADTEREVQARALREAAREMDNTDDPDAIHVSNGDIDLWLEARADRIERGEEA